MSADNANSRAAEKKIERLSAYARWIPPLQPPGRGDGVVRAAANVERRLPPSGETKI